MSVRVVNIFLQTHPDLLMLYHEYLIRYLIRDDAALIAGIY